MTAPLPATIEAAGVMFIAGKGPLRDRPVLFVQRAAGDDHGGTWCFPGGKLEGDETPPEAARREAVEEVGKHPSGTLMLLTRTKKSHEVAIPVAADDTAGTAPPPLNPAVSLPPVVDYTTYIQRVDEPFKVKLDPENTAHTWAPASSPPEPLHPGARIALDRLFMHELDIARAMVRGDLTSPQHYQNMALFALRITGTGVAFRRGIKEYVFRRPELYLNEDFLARCAGLNVIVEHPPGATLDSQEFADRIVGNIFLPYIVGDEVWGIAKIYDDTTIRMLETSQLSTSPSVVFRDPATTNTKMRLDDGSVMLVEGEAALLDHLAICLKGVWDKGGEPRGIVFETRKDSDMTEDEIKAAEAKKKADAEVEAKKKADAEAEEAKKKADAEAEEAKKKADADAGVVLDKVLAACDSISKRMDSYDAKEKAKADADAEEKRKAGDPEQVAADKAKKDAEDKAKADAEAAEKEKADKARADADAATRDSIQKLADSIPKPMSDDDLNAMADAQARADGVFSAFGKSAPRPLPGEGLLQYRRRNAVLLKVHSVAYKDADLSVISDDENGLKLFAGIEAAIYADAERAGNHPADVPADVLLETVKSDVTGRRVTTFKGQPRAWMDQFSGHRHRLTGIRNR